MDASGEDANDPGPVATTDRCPPLNGQVAAFSGNKRWHPPPLLSAQRRTAPNGATRGAPPTSWNTVLWSAPDSQHTGLASSLGRLGVNGRGSADTVTSESLDVGTAPAYRICKYWAFTAVHCAAGGTGAPLLRSATL